MRARPGKQKLPPAAPPAMSSNRWQKLLAHWADVGESIRPTCMPTLVQMAGEFATFTETTRRPNSYPVIPARGPAAQLCAGGRRFAAVAVRGDRAERGCHSAAGTAARRAGRTDHGPFHPARFQLRAVGAGGHADRDAAATVPGADQNRRRGAYPRAGERGAAGHRAFVRCRSRRDRYRSMPEPRISSSTATAPIGSRCRPRAASRSTSPANFPTCAWSFGLSEVIVNGGRQGDQAPMSDNPFAEPDDNDRTIIRPMPGGKRPGGRHRRDATTVAPPPSLPSARTPRAACRHAIRRRR